MVNTVSVAGLNHVKAAFPLLGVGVLILPATLRITFAYVHFPTLPQIFSLLTTTKPKWLQAWIDSWWKPPPVSLPEVRTDRMFKNKSLYLTPTKMQRFVVSDLQLVLERLLSGVAIDKYLDANADGSPADIQRGNEAINRALDAFLVSHPAVASTSDNPFAVLERIAATPIQSVDLLVQQLASAPGSRFDTSGSSGSSGQRSVGSSSLQDLTEQLPAVEQSRLAYRAHQRAFTYRTYTASEIDRMKSFCATPHTLAEVNKELQEILDARIQAYHEAILSAAGEAAELWDGLTTSHGRKEAWHRLGVDFVRLVTQSAKTTTVYLQEWVTIRLKADLVDTADTEYQAHLDSLVAVRAKWVERLQKDKVELVGKLNAAFESFTSPLDRLNAAQDQHARERDAAEAELARHRDSILTLPKNSLNSLDVLLAVSEQSLSKDFVCDPKHFVNSVHKFLGQGEVAFESFQQASTVRTLISQQAALEVKKVASTSSSSPLSWIQIAAGRGQCRREVVRLAADDLFAKLKSEHPYDDKIVDASRKIADAVQDRACKVLEFHEQSADCREEELRPMLAQLHQVSSELVASRDSAIQIWHKQTQALEHGMAFT